MTQGQEVLVVGAGVVGISTALALRDAGAEVTLVTAASAGDGASATNAGLLVPPDSIVWPSPGNRRQVPRTLLGRGGASIDVQWRPAVVGWGLQFLLHTTQSRYRRSSAVAHGLSDLSLDVLAGWAERHHLAFGLERNGMVFLFVSHSARSEALEAREPLTRAGETYREVAAEQLASVDPAFGQRRQPWVGLYAPHAGHGDAAAFCRSAAVALVSSGVALVTDQPVSEVVVEGGRAVGVRTPTGVRRAGHVVLAAGIGTAVLARRAGQRTSILPVKGTAATVEIRAGRDQDVPAVGGVLDNVHMAFSRTARHLRLSTGAVIGSLDASVETSSREHLRRTGELLFPGALDWDGARYEAGFRPMTAHGLPLVGRTRLPGLWINSGHGSLGWTQAAGSGVLLAALLTGSGPPIDPTPFGRPVHSAPRPPEPPRPRRPSHERVRPHAHPQRPHRARRPAAVGTCADHQHPPHRL